MMTKILTDRGQKVEVVVDLGYIDLVVDGQRLGTFGQDAPLAEPLQIKGVPYRWLYRMGGTRVGVVSPGRRGRCYWGAVLVAGETPYGGQRLTLRYEEPNT